MNKSNWLMMQASSKFDPASTIGGKFVGRQSAGLTVWFTGLSGAGKTTIASAVYTELLTRGILSVMLDGDVVRRHLNSDLGFSRRDRDENIRRIGLVAHFLTRNGIVVLVAAISPYRAVRDEVRDAIGNFLEVHVHAPLDVCESRDPKGLYKKARAGEIADFTGIDDPYEPPFSPEVRCATDQENIQSCVDKVVAAIANFFGAPMPNPEPSIPFRTLLAYTEFLAHRWLNYFQQHPTALEVNIGGKAASIRGLVRHIFEVEEFYTGRLLQEGLPPQKPESPALEELERWHQKAHEKLTQYISSVSEEDLRRTQTIGQTTVSNRKILTQTVLHSIHHWAQVAMEVRQAGFPTERPQDIIISDVME